MLPKIGKIVKMLPYPTGKKWETILSVGFLSTFLM